jgi:hypothetical protein
MKFARSLCVLAVAAVFGAGCSGGDDVVEPDVLTLADLVGSWTASSVLYTNNANATQQFDIVAAGGEFRTTVLANGGARTWVDIGTFSDEWDAQLSLNGNTLTSTPVEAARGVQTFAIALSGSTLTMTNTASSFDFSLQNGAGVLATSVLILVRQ